MAKPPTYLRLNIYVDRSDLREAVKIAAARRGVTLSAYCLEAIRFRLIEEGYLPRQEPEVSQQHAARALDSLRTKIGPIGVPVSDLVAQGRRR